MNGFENPPKSQEPEMPEGESGRSLRELAKDQGALFEMWQSVLNDALNQTRSRKVKTVLESAVGKDLDSCLKLLKEERKPLRDEDRVEIDKIISKLDFLHESLINLARKIEKAGGGKSGYKY